MKAMGEMTQAARTEAATAFVRTEYAVSGGNPESLRSRVISTELWRMAGLTVAALLLGGVGLALLEREGAWERRMVLSAALALGAAVSGLLLHALSGAVLLAEAAVLILAMWKLSPRSRRAVSLAACVIACGAILCVAVGSVHALTLSPGRLPALMLCALLAAVPGLWVRNGKEARA